ncbi:MAG: AAA family ATPase [Bacilli bacterium]|nr:AAA family ATPase [Bacilli bacterium]
MEKITKGYCMIARDKYLNQLIERIGTSEIKIVTELRRSGKSYLLNTIFINYLLSKGVDKSHIIFIELDDEKNEHLLEKEKLREYIENIVSDDNTQYYIILDEIQFVENFVRTINSLNKHKNRKKIEN